MTKRTRLKKNGNEGSSFPREPLLAQASSFQAEIRRTPKREWSVLFAGTECIEEYRSDLICLRSAGGCICIEGSDLRMLTYVNRCVEVIGNVAVVKLLAKENEK